MCYQLSYTVDLSNKYINCVSFYVFVSTILINKLVCLCLSQTKIAYGDFLKRPVFSTFFVTFVENIAIVFLCNIMYNLHDITN